MKAILFPYTYISAQTVNILRACGEPIVIYRPSGLPLPIDLKAWIAEGTLEVRTPVTGDETQLRAVLRDYRNWFSLREKADTAFHGSRPDHIPFFDGASASQIRTDIQKKLAGTTPANPSGDLLFGARIFLHLAQEFDLQQEEVHRRLAQIDHLQERIRASLAPVEDAPFEPVGADWARGAADAGGYLTVKRVRAWSRLFLADPDPSPLFVTTSRAVFEHVREGSPDVCTLAHREPLPAIAAREEARSTDDRSWGGFLERILATPPHGPGGTLSGDSGSEAIGHRPCLTLCRLPRTAPSIFWRGVAEGGFQGGAEGGGAETDHTLLGLLEKL